MIENELILDNYVKNPRSDSITSRINHLFEKLLNQFPDDYNSIGSSSEQMSGFEREKMRKILEKELGII
ncbi:MAG: hypothetical protein GF353_20990 [Candidatus Lokiarchaeota archaeon]|nr:hypothetical protein [Candidatus Lokiarchaeota archaeon]